MKKYEIAIILEKRFYKYYIKDRKLKDITFQYQNFYTLDQLDQEMDLNGLVKSKDEWILNKCPFKFLSERGFELKTVTDDPMQNIEINAQTNFVDAATYVLECYPRQYCFQREIDE